MSQPQHPHLTAPFPPGPAIDLSDSETQGHSTSCLGAHWGSPIHLLPTEHALSTGPTGPQLHWVPDWTRPSPAPLAGCLDRALGTGATRSWRRARRPDALSQALPAATAHLWCLKAVPPHEAPMPQSWCCQGPSGAAATCVPATFRQGCPPSARLAVTENHGI